MEPAEAQQAAVAFRCWWLHQPNWFPLVFIAFILDSLLLVLMGDSFPSLFTDPLFHLSSCSAFLHYFFLIGPFHSQVFLSASILISFSLTKSYTTLKALPDWQDPKLTCHTNSHCYWLSVLCPYFQPLLLSGLSCSKLLWTGITWIIHLQSTWF